MYVRYLYVYITKRHRFLDNHGDIVTKPGCEKIEYKFSKIKRIEPPKLSGGAPIIQKQF